MTSAIAVEHFDDYEKSVANALQRIGARDVLEKQQYILLKPNLVNASPHPVTTPPEFCRAVIQYLRSVCRASLVIAEGCGDASLDTPEVFHRLGYHRLARELEIPLVDLNNEAVIHLKKPGCKILPELYLPKIAFDYFIVSLPVLKAHSLSEITGSLKNMMGFAPPKYYSGRYGSWKKAAFHRHLHQAIVELNRYRTPDLTIMDATVGLAEFHLGGATCDPPVNKIIAGFDPVQVDREAAGLLRMGWRRIAHLCSR